jgi:hypothetical protein
VVASIGPGLTWCVYVGTTHACNKILTYKTTCANKLSERTRCSFWHFFHRGQQFIGTGSLICQKFTCSPFAGQCATGDLTSSAISANSNTTDGRRLESAAAPGLSLCRSIVRVRQPSAVAARGCPCRWATARCGSRSWRWRAAAAARMMGRRGDQHLPAGGQPCVLRFNGRIWELIRRHLHYL